VLLLLLILGGIAGALALFRNNTTATTPNGTPIPANGIGVTMINNEPIGISDGSFAFDAGASRPDAAVKTQAAQRFKQNNKDVSGVMSLLSQAVSQDSNDAEALIYLENMRVLASGSPYITVVVGTMISGSDSLISVGRDNLQGAYVAQKEFNDGAKIRSGAKIRVLIANTGSKTEWVNTVGQQIIQLAQSDKTFVGVMGWPFSSRAVQSVQVLGKAHIPMISQTASDDGLTGISPYFFRVAPSNKTQAVAGAHYAEQVLHAKTVALFYDPADPYSQSLANDFSQQFKADGNQVVVEEKYTVGKPETLPASLENALNAKPDFIYFSGYAEDMGKLLVNLPPGNLPIMGGDALYELGGYPSSARANFKRLHFTAFAYPDEWEVLGYKNVKPAFFTEYTTAFDPSHQHPQGAYGFTRPANDVILSYDAMAALLKGSDLAFSGGKQTITPEDVKQALGQLNGANALQGVSGQISFGPNGDPVDKAIVVLHVSPSGTIQMEATHLGRFLK
ncbi:MAG: ABC transporter substrate-binding protein, partial [Ktedonobacteraceae bacterium]|nr:ABC transporter substrate-binding protein [Ktedonobacteraceae bacterium]